MRIVFIASFSLINSAFSESSTQAEQLESLGGKVVRKSGQITQVSFTNCESLGDAEFRELGRISTLKSLTLFGGKQKLNDDTVGHLLGLQNLESLSTEGARLSDDGLAKLAALKGLRSASFFHLSFRLEGFTGKGFEAWKTIPHLEKLTVAGMSMGDEGFAAISGIRTLRELSTWHTYQTEAGNKEIAKLELRSLKIGQRLPRAKQPPSFSDQSLVVFAGMKSVEALTLTEARLTSAGLQALKSLPNLKTLRIAECDVSEEAVDALKKELPGVNVDFSPITGEQRERFEMYHKQ